MTTISAAEWRKLVKQKKRSKYRNVPVKDPVDGHFHSGSEHTRWKELRLLERSGHIRNLRRQVSFSLAVNDIHICDYIADYVYDKRPHISLVTVQWICNITEDVKGGKARTAARQVFEIKRKLMKACYGIDILITGKNT